MVNAFERNIFAVVVKSFCISIYYRFVSTESGEQHEYHNKANTLNESTCCYGYGGQYEDMKNALGRSMSFTEHILSAFQSVWRLWISLDTPHYAFCSFSALRMQFDLNEKKNWMKLAFNVYTSTVDTHTGIRYHHIICYAMPCHTFCNTDYGAYA